MGSWAGALGNIGEAQAGAEELRRQRASEALKQEIERARLATEQQSAATSQQYADIARRRQEFEEKQSKLPKYEGFTTVGNKMVALMRDPNSGTMSVKTFDIAPGIDQQFAGAAQRLIGSVKDPVRQQRLNDLWGMHVASGDFKGGYSALQQEIGRVESEDASTRRAQEAQAAAEKRQKSSQAFALAQQQRGFREREQLSATIMNAGKNAAAVDSAIKATDTILRDGALLNNLITAGKIDLTIDPQGNAQSLISRGVKLTPQEAQVATAFAALTEHINLLRGPLGAQGFRGPEAFARLQAQRGNPLANPAVTLGILRYTQENLKKMQRVNQQMLGDQRFQDIIAPIDDGQPLDLQPEN